MTIERQNFPQFFLTTASPCPYLPGQQERKVFTHLVGQDARQLNSQLSHIGFRRSQNIAYKPACEACQACTSVRVPAASFLWRKSFRRNLLNNNDISRNVVRAKATSEHYSLFRDYIDSRHMEGGMAEMSVLDFATMIDETYVESHLTEYRLDGELVAAVLVDVLDDGLSLIYSFYEPTLTQRGLGTYIILDQIKRTADMGLSYLYLGYWVQGSAKMDYKSRFMPQQRLTAGGWHNTQSV